uniref:Integrase catalytic domain-containing protein n=1 Tax=Acrobeloides nanus TaxID=290746 RepID=A0A914D759_9BILA
MVNEIFSKHGAPETITTDMGVQFMSEVFQQMVKLLGVRHIHTSAYNPAANGTCERVNRNLKATLTIYTNKYGNDWTHYLPLITHAHNCRIHKSTNYSPYYLVFGRQPVLFSDLGLKINLNHENSEVPNFVEDLKKRLTAAWQETAINIERSQQSQKEYYDRDQHARNHYFGLNDLVLFYREVPPTLERSKFAVHWQGPYRVSYVKPPNITLLDAENRPFITHVNKVKKYYP